ncbi:hypothetical protein [Corynebacterium freiburgense]|uniref:hypothetical protein n=1 Tax=Corynebacterium freiburgense TaxID=556548 RepID=UPI0003FE5E58|nr:hypothetical protein [Corynebacterium freiburgense]
MCKAEGIRAKTEAAHAGGLGANPYMYVLRPVLLHGAFVLHATSIQAIASADQHDTFMRKEAK